ncbi:hypothetical protein MMC08_006351 [Hypocenomyce scalaris]|nr:hypothetical protein [Hypocenomyce scalaris]
MKQSRIFGLALDLKKHLCKEDKLNSVKIMLKDLSAGYYGITLDDMVMVCQLWKDYNLFKQIPRPPPEPLDQPVLQPRPSLTLNPENETLLVKVLKDMSSTIKATKGKGRVLNSI